MFENEKQTVSGPGTVVGGNVKLTGTLKDVNDITVHGNVDGEVISEKNVSVTETASIKGPITAEIVLVSGKVNGSITATKKLEINPTGRVYGSIATSDLIIQSGAIFVGKSTTLKEMEPEEKKAFKAEEKKESVESENKSVKSASDAKKNEPKYEVE
ncbi:hypothetical protein A3F08_02730 [Candidatus Berkelbacteria bacterium RIFCSPHIGHO2_12_FULL_36_9]|uniref:Cell shape determination protein CcmA n=1 Tax=Candidatus Berkelbacteria bacterium RIFCSPHIGHO2_12_FULL_36_9 TaxID=1797469 RepID=A0A1F5EDS4_9BACT|nr:MAG: hypothetical protein A3F08_02730 [Candidatus Berkelbacteria bacterium RIFCSPHIGHO2_12_FULL_36_9]